MRRFIVHTYPLFECTLPHKSFVGDYKELLARNPSEAELNIFINSHTTEFLHKMIAQIPPILALLLPTRMESFRSLKSMYGTAIVRHFENLRETKRPSLVVDNTR